jgi:hypothetical protein
MIRGHLDALTPGGFAEGWAFDDQDRDRVLTVRLTGPEEEELGLGLARMFRADLARIGYRYGWCGFRLRLARPAEDLRGVAMTLCDAATGTAIHATDKAGWAARPQLDTCASMEAVLAQDPTVLRSLEHLAGCAEILAGYLARHGAEEFVRAAHAYVLQRPPDAATQASQERLLARGAVTPFGLLLLLAETEEFRRVPRLLPAPAEPGFAFAG